MITKVALAVSLLMVSCYAWAGPVAYDHACFACHDIGIAGAPKTGDYAAWAERVVKGKDILYENSIDGFQGTFGFMPPRGGRMELTDEEVGAAVDYMLNRLDQ
jgi:cytochrome c5